MGGVERFEDLIAWQKARELTKEIYLVTRNECFSKDYALSGQIQRAAVSIMANIAEGFERAGKAEFPHFLSTAKASCAELRSHLYVTLDIGYIEQPVFTKLQSLSEEVGRIICGLRTSVRKQRSISDRD